VGAPLDQVKQPLQFQEKTCGAFPKTPVYVTVEVDGFCALFTQTGEVAEKLDVG